MNDGIGSVRKLAVGHQLTYSRRYETMVVDLWSALTDPERVGRWLADLKGELRQDGAYRLDFAGGSDPAKSRTAPSSFVSHLVFRN